MPAEADEIVAPYYLHNGREWAEVRSRIVATDDEPGVVRLENGIILPARSHAGRLEGGVCDEEGRFVAGHVRSSQAPDGLNCARGYDFDRASLRTSPDRVVFCGVLICHFGHVLVDGTTRCWYLTPERVAGLKLAFVVAPIFSKHIPDAYLALIAAQGLDPEDVVLVREPTRFMEVIVPGEAFAVRDGGSRAGAEPFRRMCASVPQGGAARVYLSRGKFSRDDCVNEEYLERFYARRGFEIVHPERLPFKEQVAVIAGAQEVVATVGTLSHAATMFARPDARLTFFVRSAEVHKQQLVLDALFDRSPSYVDATHSPLPTANNVDAHLFGPSRFLRAYLDDAGLPYDEEELAANNLPDAAVVEFLRRYVRGFTKGGRRGAGTLRSLDMADVLAALDKEFGDGGTSRKDFLDCSAVEAERARQRREETQREAQREKERRERELEKEREAAREAYAYAAAWKGDTLVLRLRNTRLAADKEAEIVMVHQASGRRREIAQRVEFGDKPGTARFVLDVKGFFQGLRSLEDAGSCSRWDFFLKAPGVFSHVTTTFGRVAYTAFADGMLCEEGAVLLPHACGDKGYLCLWHLGQARSDFSQDFYHRREGRPLVNDLACRLIEQGDFGKLPALARDFRSGDIPCTPGEGRAVAYREGTYTLGTFAYLQACEGLVRRRRAKTAKARGRSLLKRARRALAALLRRIGIRRADRRSSS